MTESSLGFMRFDGQQDRYVVKILVPCSETGQQFRSQVMVYKDLTCGINVAESRWNDVFVREVI